MGCALAIILASSFAFPVWARHNLGTQQAYQAPPPGQPTAGQSSTTLSGSEIFSRARASVVVIFAASQDGKRHVLGSGFVVGRDRIATNHHVLAGMDKAYVVFSDGDIRGVSGVVADSPQQDLLILAVETGDRSQYPSAATVTGLQQMPLLWSSTTMSRIETVLREYSK